MIYQVFYRFKLWNKLPKIEQEVPVHQHTYTYTQVEGNKHEWICSECGETGIEDCIFGEWKSSDDGTNATGTCVCGRTETRTLEDLLNDESVSELTVDKVDTKESADGLTVPAGKTLIVNDTLITTKNNVTVDGTLVLKKVQNNLKLKGTGTVIYAPEATTAEEFKEKFPDAKKLLEGIQSGDQEAAKSLKYEIKVPELDEQQTIKETSTISLEKGWNLTLDLGNNILETTYTEGTFINNKGDLTLKNGVIKTPDTATKGFVLNSGANTTSTLNLDNVEILGGYSGISTNGNLVINGGKIESLGHDTGARALQIYGADLIKARETELTDVEIAAKVTGIYIHSDPHHNLVMNGGSINIEGNDAEQAKPHTAIYSVSTYSTITLNDTQITSDQIGLYLHNGANSSPNEEGGNVANLTNVTINSKQICVWTVAVGDKMNISGGSYTSTESNAISIYNNEMNYLENCTLQGEGKAIHILGSLLKDKHLSDFVTRTNVKEVDM